MAEELQDPVSKSSKPEGGGKASIGAFALSIILHAAALIFVGGYVIFEGVVPKTVFNQVDGLVDVSPDDMAAPPAPEEVMELPDTPQPTDDLAPTATDQSLATTDPLTSDLIVSSAPSTTNFNITPAAGIAPSSNPAPGMTSKAAVADISNPTGKQSVVQFFGIKAEARRVAFLLDSSGSMVTTQRGGKAGYDRLKSELTRMVQNLDSTSEFNVYIFDSTLDVFKQRAVIANDRYKQELATWIAPYMTNKFGNILNNYRTTRLRGYSGSTRLDQALTGAFEAGCDTIFVLTDGTPDVRRPPTEKELADWQKLREKNAKEIAEWEVQRKAFYEKYKDIVSEMQVEIRKQNSAVDGRDKEWVDWIKGFKGIPDRPEDKVPAGTWRPNPSLTKEDLIEYLKSLYDELYKQRGQDKPSIHVVGYSVSTQDREFLKLLSQRFSGTYKDFKGDK